jgi:hypothetical protein
VTDATKGVRLAGDDVVLGNGDELVVYYNVASDCRVELISSIAGEGDAIVLLNGEVLVIDASGSTSFEVPAGEHCFKFSFAGEGKFILSALKRKAGMKFLVR